MTQKEFEAIETSMTKRYGKIRHGEENERRVLINAIEENAVKAYARNPKANSRRMEEALLLTLYYIDEVITGKPSDTRKFENPENMKLKRAILNAFDPFTNAYVKSSLSGMYNYDLNNKADLEEYYKDGALCILRILESVRHWIKNGGSNGYFDVLMRVLYPHVRDMDEPNYAIIARIH